MDLSNLLSDYIDRIEEIGVSLDGRSGVVNFTKAALIIQGTASVYSKKVMGNVSSTVFVSISKADAADSGNLLCAFSIAVTTAVYC